MDTLTPAGLGNSGPAHWVYGVGTSVQLHLFLSLGGVISHILVSALALFLCEFLKFLLFIRKPYVVF